MEFVYVGLHFFVLYAGNLLVVNKIFCFVFSTWIQVGKMSNCTELADMGFDLQLCFQQSPR